MIYSKYKMNMKESFITYLSGVILILTVAQLFYGGVWIGILLSPLLFFYKRFVCSYLRKKRENQLKREFRDFVIALADAMKVGYSVENGMKESLRDLTMMYGTKSYMVQEIKEMLRRITLNEPVDKLFNEFSSRAKVPAITLFSQVYAIAKKTGGRVNQLLMMVADSINDSFVVDEEIQVIINGKKMEQVVMSLVPPGIIVYLKLTSPELVDILHKTILGNIVMTLCLVAYAAAIYLAYRIMERGEEFD